ncbi:MAG: pilus assembly protein PilM [Deltaproteobacteria bacterium]
MYGKFVGLDIGSDSIKIALVKKGLRRIELLETKRIKTPSSSSQQAVSEALAEIFSRPPFAQCDVAAAISADPVSVRVLNFPFSDPKKIDEVYPFELENVSTFDPSEKLHGYHLVRRDNEAEALVCMFDKADMTARLGLLAAAQIDPKAVTFEPIAFSSLDWHIVGDRPVLLIDMGDLRTYFSLFDAEGLRRVRSSSKAGRTVGESLSKTLGISLDEAETIKHSGLLGPRKAAVQEALSPLISEIKKTAQFFELEMKAEIKTLVLCGGLSLMPGIADYIAAELKRGTSVLSIADLGQNASPAFAKSFALALYGSNISRGSLNLRKGEFKYSPKGGELRKTFMLPAALAAVLVAITLYGSVSRYFDMKREVRAVESRIASGVKETFPTVAVIPKPVAFMENELKKVKDRLALFNGLVGGATPLDVLRDISGSIPEQVQLGVDEISFVDDRTVKVLGKCSSSEEVARIEKFLSDSGKFDKVIRDSTETAINNTIRFRISLALKNPNGQTY